MLDLVGGPRPRALERPGRGQPRRRVRHRPRPLAELREHAPELPTLDEALRFLAGQEVAAHVDLKLTTRLDEVADALVRHGLAERAVVSSFNRASLAAVRARAPQLRIGFTYPEDRYGVSRRRALQPAIRWGRSPSAARSSPASRA